MAAFGQAWPRSGEHMASETDLRHDPFKLRASSVSNSQIFCMHDIGDDDDRHDPPRRRPFDPRQDALLNPPRREQNRNAGPPRELHDETVRPRPVWPIAPRKQHKRQSETNATRLISTTTESRIKQCAGNPVELSLAADDPQFPEAQTGCA